MTSSRRRVALCLSIAATTGCAHSGFQHLEPTDEALAIGPTYRNVSRYDTTEYTNPDGTPGGTARTLTGYDPVLTGFSYMRGEHGIDEEDFYHLAKDQDGLDAVERARAHGRLENQIGVGLMVASLAFAIGVPILTRRENASYSVGQAFITFPVGMALAYFGKQPFESPVNSAKRGFAAIGQQPEAWTTKLDE